MIYPPYLPHAVRLLLRNDGVVVEFTDCASERRKSDKIFALAAYSLPVDICNRLKKTKSTELPWVASAIPGLLSHAGAD